MKKSLRRLAGYRSLTVASTLLLACCSAKDPTVVGKQMAAGMCQAYEQQSDKAYAVQVQLAAEMRAGSIKTRVQYADRQHELMRPVKREDSLRVANLPKLVAELDAEFPEQAARLTAGRIVTEGMAECDKAVAAREKARPDTHLRELAAQLRGPAPVEAPVYDQNGDVVPPPPPNLTLPTGTAAQ